MEAISKDEVPERLANADIFVNTTNIDNTPVSVLEAMATGLPVVSTNVGRIPYLLSHETDALLVPPDDAPAFAAAVSRLIDDPELARRLALAGRRKVEEFDWQIMLKRWDALLLDAASRGRRAHVMGDALK